MECTQRIESTQEFYRNTQERIFPEQIGFLGICGTKYPIKKGPNKIGRDPETCDIVLNLNSVSRQHAVINILNSKQYMLMDLGSANKTKLLERTLQPYIAHPMKNGDTVQFGQIFGVFRLLEDENDLPMTQALDIPDTPVLNKHSSRIINFPSTVIPESPDVSDKDDSFVAPSRPKSHDVFKSPSQNLIKKGKTQAIQPVGTKQIDNIFWNSSKKSVSFEIDLDNSDSDVIHCPTSLKPAEREVEQNIHEMETQIPFPLAENEDLNDLYTADTQLYAKSPSPSNKLSSKTLSRKNNPSDVQIICKKPETEFALNVENKENNNSIYNADTQLLTNALEDQIKDPKNKMKNAFKDNFGEPPNVNLDISDEEILFQEIDNEPLEDDFGSQPLLIPETCTDLNVEKPVEESGNNQSTYCEDIDLSLSQKITCVQTSTCDVIIGNKEKIINSNVNLDINDDSTDCEDELIDNVDKVVSIKLAGPECTHDKDTIFPSDSDTLKTTETKTSLITQNKGNNFNKNENLQVQTSDDLGFEDMLTQVIEEVDNQNNLNRNSEDVCFEDLPTQVLEVDISKEGIKPNEPQEKSPFKVPFQSTKNLKRKEITINSLNASTRNILNNSGDNDQNFYPATQDVFNDLCSQRELNTEKVSPNIDPARLSNRLAKICDDISDKSINQRKESDQRLTNEKTSMSRSESDVDSTPENLKKNITFMKTEPPNSQEIVKSITLSSRSLVTESFSDSEQENTSERCTPILFHKRKRQNNTKLDLSKKFELESLQSRTISRKRKPTAKVENNSPQIQNYFKNLHTPKIFRGQEENYDKEIIATNISRIKNKNNKEENKETKTGESNKISDAQNSAKTSKKSRDSQNTKKSRTDTKHTITEGTKEKSKTEKNEEVDSKKQQNSKNDTTRQRSTRIKQKEDKDNKIKGKKDESKVPTKDTGKRLYEEDIQDESPERGVRRSKRQKTIKKDIEYVSMSTRQARNNKTKVKNVETSHNRESSEKSIVYRLSDDSGASSPKIHKMSLKEDTTSSGSKSDTATSSDSRRSLRRTALKNIKTHKVLFTAFPSPEVKNVLQKLGADIATDVTSCTVVLTLELKRTFKLLCAVGLGKPIVGKTWIHACNDANMIVDPWLYLLKDEQRENRFNFCLERTLTGKRNFLKGYNVSSTPKVEPAASEMKMIVECSGGTYKEGGPKWICISTNEDRALWPSLKRRGAVIVSPEFVLGGVLRQKIDIEKNLLS